MIVITWVTDLINQLPALIENIMYGFIFIATFKWITYKDIQASKYILIQSIVANYILLIVYNWFINIKNFQFSNVTTQIFLILFCRILFKNKFCLAV